MASMLGSFEQAVLLAILRLGADAYGSAVLTDVQDRLDRDVAAGAVHATLVRLERKRLIASRQAPGGEIRAGRPRRFYRVLPAGRRALSEARARTARLWDGFGSFSGDAV